MREQNIGPRHMRQTPFIHSAQLNTPRAISIHTIIFKLGDHKAPCFKVCFQCPSVWMQRMPLWKKIYLHFSKVKEYVYWPHLIFITEYDHMAKRYSHRRIHIAIF